MDLDGIIRKGNGTPLQAGTLEWVSHFLLQGIFPIQGSNPGLQHCRWILYQLSHQGSPRVLEWIAYPFLADLSDPGIEQGSPALQADSLLLSYREPIKVLCCCCC